MIDLEHTNTLPAGETTSAGTELLLQQPISIRVSPQGYLTAILLGTFLSALLFYLEFDAFGMLTFAISWVLLPLCAFKDKISFDGRRLERTGLIPKAWTWLNASRRRLKLTDIEQVETQAIRTAKRGGNVYYRYRTVLRGKGLSVAFASGGEDFRRMIKGILPRLPENVLDIRSIELREHLSEPKETLMKAEFAHIPSAEVLEGTIAAISGKRIKSQPVPTLPEADNETHVEYLRSLANELRLSGYLPQSLEAFRRALIARPMDARLLLEFARCLHSFAGLARDPVLERKAIAALRLSERRAGNDCDLLVRLGETYFQIGEWRRAASVFQNILDRLGENFRAARGMAEVALREGKIAHVIHHFSSANRIAETPALRRWTSDEADYFARLNDDEEYMEMEIGRVRMLDTIESSQKTAIRIAFLAFPAIVVGVLFEDSLVANIGWAVATVSLLIWTGLIVTSRMLSQRIPYDLMPSDK